MLFVIGLVTGEEEANRPAEPAVEEPAERPAAPAKAAEPAAAEAVPATPAAAEPEPVLTLAGLRDGGRRLPERDGRGVDPEP